MTSWLIRHQRSVLFLLCMTVLGGVAMALRLPVGLFPNIDFPRVAVAVEAGDRPVERMVSEVTRPLEQALRGVPDVTNIRSTSSRGQADLSVSFDWGTDMVAAQLQLESALNRALTDLPSGTRTEVRRMDPTVFPVLGLTLRSQRHAAAATRAFALEQLRPLLSAVPGVAEVEVLGGEQPEYQIRIDPLRLRAAGVKLDDINKALAASNSITATGKLEDRNRLYLTLTDSTLRNRDDIAHAIVRGGPQGVVRLGDIADVSLEHAPNWTKVTAGGEDAVLVNVRQSRGANSVALVSDIRAQLAASKAIIPADITIGTYYDQSELVRNAAGSVRDAILIGAALSAVILLIFLRSVRLTLVVAIALPAVLLATTLLLGVLHMGFNIMTLGGMAAAVGLIADDAVVVVEHMMRRLHEAGGLERASSTGDDIAISHVHNVPSETLLHAAGEMYRPLLGSSLATIVIFVPLAFLSGVTGGFFKALALTMAAALVISFLVALFAVPLITDRLTKSLRDAEKAEDAMQRWRDRYGRAATQMLGNWLIAPIVALLMLAAGAASYLHLETGFMPVIDEGGFVLDYTAPPGTSLAESDRLLRQVETIIKTIADVDNFSRRTGLQLGAAGVTEADEGDFFVHLKPAPRRPIDEVMADVRTRIEAEIPGLQIETLQLMEDLIGDLTAVPQPIEVKLFGANRGELERSAAGITDSISKLPGVVEVKNGIRVSGDSLEVRIDAVRAAIEGLDAQAITAQLSTLVGGTIVGQVQAGERVIDLRLQAMPDLRKRIESLSELRLQAADGHDLPLRRVATVSVKPGQAQITRENLAQMVAVTARLEGRDLGSGMRDVQRAVRALALPPGVRVVYGGLWKEQQKSFAGLTSVLLAGLLLVTALLLYLYERWAVVGAILGTVALSSTGVFAGLWLTGTPLDISSLMGMTMIVGIVTEIAIFYFAEIDTNDAPTAAALVHAGKMRLRPILMTTLIAILALLPLAIGLGAGSAMQTPLAIAIISGLITALPLVLLMMPTLYLRLSGIVGPTS